MRFYYIMWVYYHVILQLVCRLQKFPESRREIKLPVLPTGIYTSRITDANYKSTSTKLLVEY